jgi:hypothetical protein
MQILIDALLYVTSIATIFTLFASIIASIFWLLKVLVLWLAAEPEPTASKSKQFRPQNLDCLIPTLTMSDRRVPNYGGQWT